MPLNSLVELVPIAMPALDLLGATQIGLALVILLLSWILLAAESSSRAVGMRGRRNVEREGYQAHK